MRKHRTGQLLHDYIGIHEGGGRVALTLADAWQWPLVCGFLSSELSFREDWPGVEFKTLGVRSGARILQTFALIKRWSRYTPDLTDVSIFSGTYSPLATARTAGMKMLYCHSPPRFIYDQKEFFRINLPMSQRLLLDVLTAYLQPRYESAIRLMDLIVANSNTVQERLKRYLGVSAPVVYPPCDVRRFTWMGQEEYFLSTGRLDPLKRIDTIVQAFLRMPDKRLIIASGGEYMDRLKREARGATNIEFVGWLREQQMARLVGNCIATIYIPRDEDFGISPVESMAAGKPVIGAAEGGLMETIVDGETGVLIDGGAPVLALMAAVRSMSRQRACAMRLACEERAQAFSQAKFIEKMEEIVLR